MQAMEKMYTLSFYELWTTNTELFVVKAPGGVWDWTLNKSQQAYQSVSDAFDYMNSAQKMRRNLEFGMPAATSTLSSAASALTSWRSASQTTLGEVEVFSCVFLGYVTTPSQSVL